MLAGSWQVTQDNLFLISIMLMLWTISHAYGHGTKCAIILLPCVLHKM